MNRKIHHYLSQDHERLDQLLQKAFENPRQIDLEAYHQFRTGLLKHIKMEEKVLFPAARKANANEPIPLAAKLKLDHGALSALMLLPPSEEVRKAVTFILEKHDILEEQEGGMYDLCEKLTENETDEILAQLKAVTDVPVHPYNATENALQVTKNALQRAGYDYDEIVRS